MSNAVLELLDALEDAQESAAAARKRAEAYRLVLAGAVVACFALFWLALAGWLR